MSDKRDDKQAVWELLKETVSKDVNILNSRDHLINELEKNIKGGSFRYLRPIVKALQNNVGEIFLNADRIGTDEVKKEAIERAEEILRKSNTLEKNIKDVIEAFTYALNWTKESVQEEFKAENEKSEEADEERIIEDNTWTCTCGTENTDKFCFMCGRARGESESKNEWVCPQCGRVNKDKFCENCGYANGEKTSAVVNNDNMEQESTIDADLKTVSLVQNEASARQNVESEDIDALENKSKSAEEKLRKEKREIKNIHQSPQPTYETKENKQESEQQAISSGMPSSSNNSKLKAIYIFIIIILLILVGTLSVKLAEDKEADIPTENTVKTESASNEPSNKDTALKVESDLSLGGVELGNTLDQAIHVLGRENSIETKGRYKFYDYSSIQVGIKDEKVDALVSNDASVSTKRGIHQNSSLQEVFDKYGKDYAKSNYDSLTLYEYIFKAIDGRDGILRFAVNKNNRVDYISVRIAENDKDSNNSNENRREALKVLTNYYEAISRHDMIEAYNILSADMQKHMGDLDVYAAGYQTTMSDQISNVQIISDDGDIIDFSYVLTARDKYNRTEVKVQKFYCTTRLSKKTGSWHIVDISAEKQGEYLESR